MKLKIMIMTLLLLLVGIGSAMNKLPATEFVGDIDFADGYFARNATEGIYNAKDFGATGDGMTDDAPAIQAAIHYAHEHGGGIVYAPPGTYLQNSSQHPIDARVLNYPESGVYLVGSGTGSTIFRVGDGYRSRGLGTYQYFNSNTSTLVEDFGICGITWDGNGYNNPINVSISPTDSRGGIGGEYCRNFVIMHNEFENWNGRWCIMVNGANIDPDCSGGTIRENIVRNFSTIVDPNIDDCAAIYCTVSAVDISENKIIPPFAVSVGSSIEVHADHQVVCNNVIKNMKSGIFIAPVINTSYVEIVDNDIWNVSVGISTWGIANRSSKEISIRGNNINLWSVASPVGINHGGPDVVWDPDAIATGILDIRHNTINGNGYTSNSRGVAIHDDVSIVTIEENIVNGTYYYGIGTDDSVIGYMSVDRNNIIDCGFADSAYFGRGILISVYVSGPTVGHVSYNKIWNVTQTMPAGYDAIMFILNNIPIDIQCRWNEINPDISIDYSTQGTLNGDLVIHKWGTAAPESGAHSRGSCVENRLPSASGVDRWRCTTTGNPGTWKSVALSA